MSDYFNLSEAQVIIFSPKALKGDADSASRLTRHFYQLDAVQGAFWEQIAAENGDTVGQFNFALNLLENKDERSRMRARFWLERAAANGASPALDLLGQLPPE